MSEDLLADADPYFHVGRHFFACPFLDNHIADVEGLLSLAPELLGSLRIKAAAVW